MEGINATQFLLLKRSAQLWIEKTLAETLGKDDLFVQLMDGVILCKILQKISPSLVPRIRVPSSSNASKSPSVRKTTIFKNSENISFFLQGCVDMGVPRHKRFLIHDLLQNQITFQAARRVLECIKAVCEVACSDKKYEFDVKWPDVDAKSEKLTKEAVDAANNFVQQSQSTQVVKKGSVELKKAESAHQQELKQAESRRSTAALKIQSCVRGWRARTQYRSLVRDYAYREHVAQEIFSTEKVYVEHLTYLIQNVLQPLRQALDKGNPILGENEIRAIFSEIESIANYNKLLLKQLEERVPKWSSTQQLGDIFLLIANFLKIYSQYCSNYDDSMRVLNECKQQKGFKKFLDEIKKKNYEIEHAGLENFLIRPVQRIPRYFLLLQDLVKHTAKDHPDFANLELAVQKVQSVAGHMNEKKREAENIMKVTEIQDMIEGECDVVLPKPHRRFVREGQVSEFKQGTTRKQPVVLFLFNDLLVITKPQGTSFLGRSKQPKLKFSTSMKLVGAKVSALDDNSAFKHIFEIISAGKRVFVYMCETLEDRDLWVSSMQSEIDGATSQERKQDKRITEGVFDKVEDLKRRVEISTSTTFQADPRRSMDVSSEPGLLRSSSELNSRFSSSAGSPSLSPSSSAAEITADGAAPGSPSITGDQKPLSVRERYLLAKTSRRDSTSPGTSPSVQGRRDSTMSPR